MMYLPRYRILYAHRGSKILPSPRAPKEQTLPDILHNQHENKNPTLMQTRDPVDPGSKRMPAAEQPVLVETKGHLLCQCTQRLKIYLRPAQIEKRPALHSRNKNTLHIKHKPSNFLLSLKIHYKNKEPLHKQSKPK